jgi:hypothetical protein
VSITGEFILSNDPAVSNTARFEPSYILRYHLDRMHRHGVESLLKAGHTGTHILRAAEHLRDELHSLYVEIIEGQVEDEPDQRELYNVGAGATPTQPEDFRGWLIYADPQGPIECIYETYGEQLNGFFRSGPEWTWAHIYTVLSLWCVDESAAFLNRGELMKASEWRSYAARYSRYATTFDEATPKPSTDQVLQFSKLGSDARHAENRRVKAHAIELFMSKTWKSQAAAARQIAAQVHRTELVVMGWLREHRKSSKATSPGTPTTAPEQE